MKLKKALNLYNIETIPETDDRRYVHFKLGEKEIWESNIFYWCNNEKDFNLTEDESVNWLISKNETNISVDI